MTFRTKVKVRFGIGTLAEKVEHDYKSLSDSERVRILRAGGTHEQEAMLRAVARHDVDDPVEFAVIDLLACSVPAVQSSALQLIVKKDLIAAAAWKIAYELRGRAVYVWELLDNAKIMSKFAETPPLGAEKARGALEFVRRGLVQESPRSNFEERFHTFTLKDEPIVAAAEATRRLKDKTLCRKCGARMSRRPDLVHQHGYVADLPVALRCEACDITRFENSSEVG